jgi:cytidylate kinase
MRVITVSRSYGSAGTIFARQLSEALGYGYVDDTHISEIDQAEGVRKTLAMNVEDESAPGFFEKIAELKNNTSFFKVALETCIYDLALKDDMIFVGGAAHIVLEEFPCLIAVQIVRDYRERIKAIASEKGISYDEAHVLVKKKDKDKINFVRHYFDRELVDPTMFHFIINASRVPIDDAVQIVAEETRKIFSAANDQEADRFLRKRLTERKAQLILFALNMTHRGKITFEAQDKGVLVVKGVIGGKTEKEHVLETLSKLPEVETIDDHLKVGILSRTAY